MTSAERWVRMRLAGAPPALLDAMVGALPAAEGTVPDALAEGALVLYAAVLGGGDGRDAALPLLAADALMTHALEACAEHDADAVAGFAERYGAAGRLGRMAAG